MCRAIMRSVRGPDAASLLQREVDLLQKGCWLQHICRACVCVCVCVCAHVCVSAGEHTAPLHAALRCVSRRPLSCGERCFYCRGDVGGGTSVESVCVCVCVCVRMCV